MEQFAECMIQVFYISLDVSNCKTQIIHTQKNGFQLFEDWELGGKNKRICDCVSGRLHLDRLMIHKTETKDMDD